MIPSLVSTSNGLGPAGASAPGASSPAPNSAEPGGFPEVLSAATVPLDESATATGESASEPTTESNDGATREAPDVGDDDHDGSGTAWDAGILFLAGAVGRALPIAVQRPGELEAIRQPAGAPEAAGDEAAESRSALSVPDPTSARPRDGLASGPPSLQRGDARPRGDARRRRRRPRIRRRRPARG